MSELNNDGAIMEVEAVESAETTETVAKNEEDESTVQPPYSKSKSFDINDQNELDYDDEDNLNENAAKREVI